MTSRGTRSAKQGRRTGASVARDEWVAELTARLDTCASKDEREEVLWQLVVAQSDAGHPEAAVPYAQDLLAGREEPGARAFLLLSLGQLMEQVGDLQGAISYYTDALGLQAGTPEVRYLLHNNLGFCLNQFKRFAEAEALCRAAIDIDPARHNAHKNLGVALEGQGRYAEAAQSYLEAAIRNPADPRAMRHLDTMLAQHPEIPAADAELRGTLEECRALAGPQRWIH